MIKTKGVFQLLILQFCLVLSLQSYAQDSTNTRIKWVFVPNAIFCNDKALLIDWSKAQMPFPTAYPKEFRIQDTSILVVEVSGYSGLIRSRIFVFKEIGDYWKLVVGSEEIPTWKLRGSIEMEIAAEQQKLIFKVQGVQIGELPLSNL